MEELIQRSLLAVVVAAALWLGSAPALAAEPDVAPTEPTAGDEAASTPAMLEVPQSGDGEPPAAPTTYYRWVDRNGQVQYTDFEPEGIPSEPLDLTPDESNLPPGISVQTDSPGLDAVDRQDNQIVPIEQIGPCGDARAQLALLHSRGPVYLDGDVYRPLPQDARRAPLDDEARGQAIRAAQQGVLTHCGDPAAIEQEREAFREAMQRGESR